MLGGASALATQDTKALKVKTQARADARALGVAASVGTAVGLALGGAYLGSGMAGQAASHAKITRLASGATAGFSETALQQQAAGMDPGALAVAQRHDPFGVGGERDRQAAVFAAQLEAKARQKGQNDPLVVRAGLRGAIPGDFAPVGGYAPFTVSARPFSAPGVNALESTRDLECLAQAVYYEARGETSAGQAAVAQVVLNRVRNPAFPKTICGVVFQGAHAGSCQFSFACDGSMRRQRETVAWRRAEQVAARALGGAVASEVGNATHFHVVGVAPGWGGMMRVAQVGLHVFYRFGGRAGAPDNFLRTPERSIEADRTLQPVYASFAPMAATPQPDRQPAAAPVILASAVLKPEASGPAAKPVALEATADGKPAAKAAPDAAKSAKPSQDAHGEAGKAEAGAVKTPKSTPSSAS